jgi:hypothetical protein
LSVSLAGSSSRLLRHGGLGEQELLCGTGEAAAVGDSNEDPQLCQIQQRVHGQFILYRQGGAKAHIL